MHPAYSVILFTTASGAGYGLLIWYAVDVLFGFARLSPLADTLTLLAALALISVGLLASTAHLGRPTRAWRAFSQWRTSWLSREGVLAMATFVPALLLLLASLFSTAGFSTKLFALLAITGAAATVWCTGMIYQSLPTIRAWHMPLVAPIYLGLALATGAVLMGLATVVGAQDGSTYLGIAAISLTSAFALKTQYWRAIDAAPRALTAGDATGLGHFGKVRVLDDASSRPTYIMREMGYTVARKHAEKLRTFAATAGFVLPALLLLVAMRSGPILATVLVAAAVVLMTVGILTERWLFFAEAQHVVTLYHGADSA